MKLLDYVKKHSREMTIISNKSDVPKAEPLKSSKLDIEIRNLVNKHESISNCKSHINTLVRNDYFDRWQGEKYQKDVESRFTNLKAEANKLLSKGIDLRLITGNSNSVYATTYNKVKFLCDELELVLISIDLLKDSVFQQSRVWYSSYEKTLCNKVNSYVLCSIDSIDIQKLINDDTLLDPKYTYLGKFQEAFDNLTISLPIVKTLEDSQRGSTITTLSKRLETMADKSSKSKNGWYGVFNSESNDDDYLCYNTHNTLNYDYRPVSDILYELPKPKVETKKVESVKTEPKKVGNVGGKLIEVYQGIEIREDDKGLFYYDTELKFDSDNAYKTSSAIKSAIRAYVKKKEK